MPFLLNFKEKQLKKNEEGFHLSLHKQKIHNYSPPPQALLTPRRHNEIALIKSKKRTSPGM